ncbi:unnamed protein product [Moneuplotes crassus]|uniref:Uncharacterized protein n=1 Tax=Euplotes crassus TaxID=5936 RepID=A0AAD1Y8L5_EUPCR|nr:unnamed protein product [Moneuplotes crassus]
MVEKLIQAYRFDFNKHIVSGPTFEQKVMNMNVNDLGLPEEGSYCYSPETAHIMITEFRKFMVLNAGLILLEQERTGANSTQKYFYKDIIGGKTHYSSAIFPPSHIDRIWKLLILHSQTYSDFCQLLCGGYIDRQEPNFEDKLEITLSQINKLLYEFPKYLNVFINLPYFEADYIRVGNKRCAKIWKYEIGTTHNNRIPISEVVKMVDQTYDEFTHNDSVSFDDALKIADKVLNSLPKKTSANLELPIIQFDNSTSQLLFDTLLSIEFPEDLLGNFQNYWLLSDNFAACVFVEYLKYLVLETLSNSDVAPSFWIDQLWHSHMTYTKHYRDTCTFLKETALVELSDLDLKPKNFIGHYPCGDSDQDNRDLEKIEEDMVALYQHYFGMITHSEITRFQADYKPGEKVMSVNILGLVTSRYLRRDPDSEDNELNKYNLIFYQTMKELIQLHEVSQSQNLTVNELKIDDTNIPSNCVEGHFQRIHTRNLLYDKHDQDGDLNFRQIGQDQNSSKLLQDWRAKFNYKICKSVDEKIQLNTKYSVLNEAPIFSNNGMIFMGQLKQEDEKLKMNLSSYTNPLLRILSCSLPNLADAIESELDIFPKISNSFSEKDYFKHSVLKSHSSTA